MPRFEHSQFLADRPVAADVEAAVADSGNEINPGMETWKAAATV